MLKALIWIEFILSILLITAVMLQNRGTGLGGAFASDANVYRSKRGIEKFLFNSTIVFATVLVVAVVFNLYLKIRVTS
jgi:preprotein translocase subunit SecG